MAVPLRVHTPKLSPSQAKDLQCPRLFHAKHLARSLPPGLWTRSLANGEGLHAALKAVYYPNLATPPAQRDLERLTRAAYMRQGYPSPFERNEDADTALGIISAYLAQDVDAGNVRETEVYVTYPARGLPDGEPILLSARLDRCDVRPNEPDVLRVTDYKTGAVGRIDWDAATVLYGAAWGYARKRGFSRVVVEYHFLGIGGLIQRVEIEREAVLALWPEIAERAEAVLHGNTFPAVPGALCHFCPLADTCDAVSADSDDPDEWDFLTIKQ